MDWERTQQLERRLPRSRGSVLWDSDAGEYVVRARRLDKRSGRRRWVVVGRYSNADQLADAYGIPPRDGQQQAG